MYIILVQTSISKMKKRYKFRIYRFTIIFSVVVVYYLYRVKHAFVISYSQEINRSNRRIIKQTFVSDVLEIPEKIENSIEYYKESIQRNSNNIPVSTPNRPAIDSTTEEEEEDDWETMYDDSGECLDPKIMQELTASVGKVKIELPKMDYSVSICLDTH